MQVIRSILKFTLLYAAAIILLLHSFVPHQHHSSAGQEIMLTSCVHVENSLLDFLGKVFHIDLGGEHLENYQTVKKVDFGLDYALVAAVLIHEITFQSEADQQIDLTPWTILWESQYQHTKIAVRGPPTA